MEDLNNEDFVRKVEKSAWETIKENPKYQVSPYGYIRHKRTKKIRGGCPISTGYLQIEWDINNKTHKKLVHRLVAETYIPNPQCYKRIRHIDGNKLNNRIGNLEWIKPKR